MSAPILTDEIADTLRAAYPGGLTVLDTPKLTLVVKPPSREAFAARVNAMRDPEQLIVENNNIVLDCLVWPEVKAVEAAFAATPGLVGKLATECSDLAYGDRSVKAVALASLSAEERTALPQGTAALFETSAGRVALKAPSRIAYEQVTAKLEKNLFEAFEGIFFSCVVQPSQEDARKAFAALPGVPFNLGAEAKRLGDAKGEVRRKKL